MTEFDGNSPPAVMGGWQDAEVLRRWSFARRTPQQRLAWLVEALTIRHVAMQARAAADGRRTAEIRTILEDATHPEDRVKLR